MNVTHVAIASAVFLTVASGCRREESAPAAPPPTSQSSPQTTQPPVSGTTEPGRTVGETAGDAAVTARVKTALLQADDVKGLQIDVDTVDGVVTLKGDVDTQTQVDRVASIAKVAEGVKDVRTELAVRGGGTGATK